MRAWGLVQLALLVLAYTVPYGLLRDASSWVLYIYWLALGVASIVVAWLGTRGWYRLG